MASCVANQQPILDLCCVGRAVQVSHAMMRAAFAPQASNTVWAKHGHAGCFCEVEMLLMFLKTAVCALCLSQRADVLDRAPSVEVRAARNARLLPQPTMVRHMLEAKVRASSFLAGMHTRTGDFARTHRPAITYSGPNVATVRVTNP